MKVKYTCTQIYVLMLTIKDVFWNITDVMDNKFSKNSQFTLPDCILIKLCQLTLLYHNGWVPV